MLNRYEKRYDESKQVGVIYHFKNTIESVLIILEHGLLGNQTYAQNMSREMPHIFPNQMDNMYSYSFTRSMRLSDRSFGKMRFKLDGNKMSTRYRFEPVSEEGFYRNNQTSEFEERIISKFPKIDLKPYIIDISIPEKEADRYNKDWVDLQDYCNQKGIILNVY